MGSQLKVTMIRVNHEHMYHWCRCNTWLLECKSVIQSFCSMSVFGGLLRSAVTFCQSSALLCSRSFSTGVWFSADPSLCALMCVIWITCLMCILCVAGTCARIRMHAIPKLKEVDRWTEKRSMFGVYDNIGILGERLV